MTTRLLAKLYGTQTNNILSNFHYNKNRFIEGRDYFCLKGDELKNFKSNFSDIDKFTSVAYLWTKRGAFLHAKSLNTDEAWQQFDLLKEAYFRSKEKSRESYKKALLQRIQQIQ